MLGVGKDADAKAIRDAFRALALKYHPDRNKAPEAEEKFKEIAEAYAVLSDPKKRKEYDSRGFAGVSDFSQEDLFGGINFEDLFGGGMGFDFGDFGGGSIFERFFHPGGRHPSRGADIRVEVTVALEKILTGTEETVTLSHPRVCPECGGSGSAKGSEPRVCTTCNGTGQVTSTRKQGNVSYREIRPCPTCHGRGKIIDHPCPKCGGSGTVDEPESLNVKIPPGAEEGMVLRIPGHGMPAPQGGEKAGDLLVIVRSAYDPRFERSGADLWRRITIPLTAAVLGDEVGVESLDGPVRVRIPAGSQNDAVLRLVKKGLPHFGGTERGDLYLRLNVRIPEKLSDEERKLFERLREIGRE